MNQGELVDAIAEKSGILAKDAKAAIHALGEIVVAALAKGEEIRLPIGTFSAGERAARKGRNLHTGETIDIPAARVAKFRAAKLLKTALNPAPKRKVAKAAPRKATAKKPK
jgi:DNA-binding protein HU-beta